MTYKSHKNPSPLGRLGGALFGRLGGASALFVILILSSCSISYKLNGSNIDYNKVKTLTLSDFPIRASYVWSPMQNIFNTKLKEEFRNHTKLSMVKRNGDLKIEGEITQYNQRNKSVGADGYSAQTELSMTVNVRFTNNTNHQEDFERQFTSTADYSSSLSLNSVQENLVTEMVKDIVNQIFSATVATW